MTEALYNLRAEERAVEEGHRAFLQEDGSFLVHSDTRDGVRYRVTYYAVGPLIRFECGPEAPGKPPCPAGQHRKELCCCKHAALVARRLEREGIAVWRDGLWHVADHLVEERPQRDPFEDLEGN